MMPHGSAADLLAGAVDSGILSRTHPIGISTVKPIKTVEPGLRSRLSN